MSCLDVRGLLPEHALGLLGRREETTVERHLEWCAACRKEVAGLERAAATVAFAAEPAEPPAGLEDRVVDAVRRAAGRRAAAVLALTGLGWGAVMAGRNARLRSEVALAKQHQQQAFVRFRKVLDELEFSDPANVVELADLMSPRRAVIGGGDALVLLSPSSDDVALVAFTGVTDVSNRSMPVEVWLESDSVPDVLVGRIHDLDTDGGGGVRRWFLESLKPFDDVVVRDARGHVLLRGTLTVYDPTG